MGQNIGTCVTAILSSIGANKGAKRVAAVHLSFNLIGTVVFLIAFYGANAVIGFDFMDKAVAPQNIAVVHSIFNVSATFCLLPFYKQLEKLAMIVVKDSAEPEKKAQDGTLTFLDERFLETPSVAVMECKAVAAKMANLSRDSIVAAMNLVDKYDEDKFEYVNLLESKIDRYEDALSAYIIKLERQDLSIEENNVLNAILHNVGDLERISDHAKNIAEVAHELHTKGIQFSEEAKREVSVYMAAVEEIVTIAVQSFVDKDMELAANVEPLEEVIDEIHAKVKDGHIERLRKGQCTIELGFILSDLGTNLERVADHCSNLAICTIETANDGFDMHKYARRLKKYDIENFEEKEREFAAKYSLN